MDIQLIWSNYAESFGLKLQPLKKVNDILLVHYNFGMAKVMGLLVEKN